MFARLMVLSFAIAWLPSCTSDGSVLVSATQEPVVADVNLKVSLHVSDSRTSAILRIEGKELSVPKDSWLISGHVVSFQRHELKIRKIQDVYNRNAGGERVIPIDALFSTFIDYSSSSDSVWQVIDTYLQARHLRTKEVRRIELGRIFTVSSLARRLDMVVTGADHRLRISDDGKHALIILASLARNDGGSSQIPFGDLWVIDIEKQTASFMTFAEHAHWLSNSVFVAIDTSESVGRNEFKIMGIDGSEIKSGTSANGMLIGRGIVGTRDKVSYNEWNVVQVHDDRRMSLTVKHLQASADTKWIYVP